MNSDHLIRKVIIIFLQLAVILSLSSCSEEKVKIPFPPETNPWQSIRAERMEKLLPAAMENAGVDAWILICRENNNDPLAYHVGGENAVGTSAFLFLLEDGGVKSIVLAPKGDESSLVESGTYDEVIVVERNMRIHDELKNQIEKYDPKKIAVNSSNYNIADGLSFTQRNNLEESLGKKYSSRMVSSTDLVYEWLSVKLPREIEIMKKAAAITVQLELDAYKTVVPGKTKDSDVAKYLKKRMAELGVTDAWSPEQNPSVNSGPDRGHSHATEKIIQPGDVIQMDFGIKVYDIWCTDIQRFAYVLKPGETKAPEDIQEYFDVAIQGHRKVLAAMKPGVNGWSVDKVQREWLEENKSLPVMWSTGHPVGYWAHDAGPALGGAAHWHEPFRTNAKLLRPGQTFAYDGFYVWELTDSTTKTFSVEEMAVVTEDGAEYMNIPQEELILISSGS
jgi:Xaa-Pro aminopeptidase